MATARSLGRAGGDVENVMYYEVYPAQGLQADELEIMRRQLLESVLPHMHGHIWQRDCFNLRSSFVKRPPWQQQAAGKGAQPACLWGSVCFGDNLEDEWFVTWLLLELTRRQAGTVVRAWDSDGDYLLIEAAYSLPKWLKPETSHNRVWLHNGKVHVVLLPSASNPSLPPAPTVEQALQIVRAEGVSTEASAGVQRAITDRLAGYPAKAAAEMHTARCVLPARLAHVLSREQQLVAPAVEAFHYRDVDDMKAAARLAHFPAEDMVSTLVTFNRCLYAQLAQQQFEAPRGFPLPLPSHPAFRAAELGMKLTCGFEMMYCNRARFGAGAEAASNVPGTEAEPAGSASVPAATAAATPASERAAAAGQRVQNRTEDGTAGAAGTAGDHLQAGQPAATCRDSSPQPAPEPSTSYRLPSQLKGDPGWQTYRASLERHNFFQGNIPGSGKHTGLLRHAAEQYQQTEVYQQSTVALAAPARRLEELLKEPINPEALQQAGAGAEDDDSWMRSGAAELEAELQQRQQEMQGDLDRHAARSAGQPAADSSFDPANLASQLQEFVATMSSYEGAELPDSGREVSLDDKAFMQELRRVLGVEMDAAEAPASDSEEGSSFFSESASSDSSDDEAADAAAQQAQQRARSRSGLPPRATANGHASAGPGKQQPTHVPAAHAHDDTSVQASWPSRASRQDPPADAAQDAQQQDWETKTATDSDDAGYTSDQFRDEYDRVLSSQLGASAMAASFERASLAEQSRPAGPSTSKPQATGPTAQLRSASAAASPADRDQDQVDGEEPLQPVDVDLNLVQSLLASYASQQGLPGPASNLAGLLGLRLPENADTA